MKPLLIALLSLAPIPALAASASALEEQTRRCNMEKGSLTNPRGKEGAECLKLRAMLGMPEPPVVNNHYSGGSGSRRIFDAQSNRWCRVYEDGRRMQCD